MKTRAQEIKESKNQGSEGPPGCAKRLNDKDKGKDKDNATDNDKG